VDPTDIMFEGTKWVKAAQNRVQWRTLINTIINFSVPRKAENFITCFATICFSRSPLSQGVGEFTGTVVDSDWQLRLHVQLAVTMTTDGGFIVNGDR
jgi:hypothetical protein